MSGDASISRGRSKTSTYRCPTQSKLLKFSDADFPLSETACLTEARKNEAPLGQLARPFDVDVTAVTEDSGVPAGISVNASKGGISRRFSPDVQPELRLAVVTTEATDEHS